MWKRGPRKFVRGHIVSERPTTPYRKKIELLFCLCLPGSGDKAGGHSRGLGPGQHRVHLTKHGSANPILLLR